MILTALPRFLAWLVRNSLVQNTYNPGQLVYGHFTKSDFQLVPENLKIAVK